MILCFYIYKDPPCAKYVGWCKSICCTPQIVDKKKPRGKQEFLIIEEAFNFYNAYARKCGSSARMSNSRKKLNKWVLLKGTNELVWKKFNCFNEGETNEFYQKKL